MAGLCLAAVCLAQAPAGTPSFAVASIHMASGGGDTPYRLGPNSFSMEGSLEEFAGTAYEVQDYQVSGAPAWSKSAWYSIQANAEGQADSHQIRLMLQTLLADRFHLKVHRETRIMQGYALLVDKGGPKLPPATAGLPPGSNGMIQRSRGITISGSTSMMRRLRRRHRGSIPQRR